MKQLLAADIIFAPGIEDGYSFYEKNVEYAGVKQKWILVSSEKGRMTDEKKYSRNLEKGINTAQKSLKKLLAKEFACESDARMAARIWFEEHLFLSPDHVTIELKQKKKNGKRGRPGKDEELETVFILSSPLETVPEVIEREKSRLGRFDLATNDLDLDSTAILKYYKGQQSVERGFRFLKDKSFRVVDVFLKKESRIEALSMIMVLCLFIYAVAEGYLHVKLKEMRKTVNNQLKKPIQNPTMKWIFMLFMRLAEVTLTVNSQIQRFIVNLDDEVTQILGIRGSSCEKYYFIQPTCEI